MPPRAVLFDVYGTLLSCRPRPDAEARRQRIARRHGLGAPESIEHALDAEIARLHAASPARHPEVDLRDVWCAVLDGLPRGNAAELAGEMEHALHELEEMPGARAAMRRARRAGLRMGIVSNAQHSTRGFLAALLGEEFQWIDPDLCAFSYRHGIGKPDRELFRRPIEALADGGIRRGEVLMIGDRVDNDIRPALELGLRALHFGSDLESWDDWQP